MSQFKRPYVRTLHEKHLIPEKGIDDVTPVHREGCRLAYVGIRPCEEEGSREDTVPELVIGMLKPGTADNYNELALTWEEAEFLGQAILDVLAIARCG